MSTDKEKLCHLRIRLVKSAESIDIVEPIPRADMIWIIERARQLFQTQSSLLRIDAPISICGDVHGQFGDLIEIFNITAWPPASKFLFLGDFVDRGPRSVQTVCLLFVLAVEFPDHVYLLRGNHETQAVNATYGFKQEVLQRYDQDVYDAFNASFEFLPLAALISGRIIGMHGGISNKIRDLEEIGNIVRPLKEIEDGTLAADLLWADPSDTAQGFVPSPRGMSFKFGQDAVVEFCQKLDLDLVVRAHEVVHTGVQVFSGGQVVTVFSAPNYGGSYGNAGGILKVDGNLTLHPLKFAASENECWFKRTMKKREEERKLLQSVAVPDRPSSSITAAPTATNATIPATAECVYLPSKTTPKAVKSPKIMPSQKDKPSSR